MTIKAILRDGQIQPLEPLPSGWSEGQEPVVEEPELSPTETEIEQWSNDIEAAAARIPAEEHERFRLAISEIE